MVYQQGSHSMGLSDNIQGQHDLHFDSFQWTCWCFHSPSIWKPSPVGIHLMLHQAVARHWGAGGVSKQLPLGRISGSCLSGWVWWYRWATYTTNNIQIVSDIYTHNLDSHLMSPICTPWYISRPTICNLHRVLWIVWDVHRSWDHAMSTACFAKLIE